MAVNGWVNGEILVCFIESLETPVGPYSRRSSRPHTRKGSRTVLSYYMAGNHGGQLPAPGTTLTGPFADPFASQHTEQLGEQQMSEAQINGMVAAVYPQVFGEEVAAKEIGVSNEENTMLPPAPAVVVFSANATPTASTANTARAPELPERRSLGSCYSGSATATVELGDLSDGLALVRGGIKFVGYPAVPKGGQRSPVWGDEAMRIFTPRDSKGKNCMCCAPPQNPADGIPHPEKEGVLICGAKLFYKDSGSTGNLMRHYERNHAAIHEEMLQKSAHSSQTRLKKAADLAGRAGQQPPVNLMKDIQRMEHHRRYVLMCCVDMRPASMNTNRGFKLFCAGLCPHYTQCHSCTYDKILVAERNAERQRMRARFEKHLASFPAGSGPAFEVELDLWTSA